MRNTPPHIRGKYRAVPVFRKPEQTERLWTRKTIYRMVALHAILGPILKLTPMLSALYALAVGVYCLYLVFRTHRLDRMLAMMGYIAGAEVLIRMTRAPVFWMYSEYLVILLAFGILYRVKTTQSPLIPPLWYILLLLPSTIPVLVLGDFVLMRELLAFNLLGPIALGLGVFAVSRVQLSRLAIENALLYAILPNVAVAGIIGIAYMGGGVEFYAINASSKDAAGGFAPNQVSNILSFASCCLFTLIFSGTQYRTHRSLFIGLLLAMTVFALMTLSRGGVYNFVGFVAGMVPFLVKNGKQGVKIFLLIAVLTFVYIEVLIPELDTYSKGALSRRYDKVTTTHREELIDDELQAFFDSPILGQGVGLASSYRKLSAYVGVEGINTHTEYTRLLAEHGLFGIAAMIALLLTFLRIYQRAKPGVNRGFIVGSVAWIMIFFSHSATRIVAFGILAVFATALSSVIDEAPGGTDAKAAKGAKRT